MGTIVNQSMSIQKYLHCNLLPLQELAAYRVEVWSPIDLVQISAQCDHGESCLSVSQSFHL